MPAKTKPAVNGWQSLKARANAIILERKISLAVAFSEMGLQYQHAWKWLREGKTLKPRGRPWDSFQVQREPDEKFTSRVQKWCDKYGQ